MPLAYKNKVEEIYAQIGRELKTMNMAAVNNTHHTKHHSDGRQQRSVPP